LRLLATDARQQVVGGDQLLGIVLPQKVGAI
jgi:hypothetical protein